MKAALADGGGQSRLQLPSGLWAPLWLLTALIAIFQTGFMPLYSTRALGVDLRRAVAHPHLLAIINRKAPEPLPGEHDPCVVASVGAEHDDLMRRRVIDDLDLSARPHPGGFRHPPHRGQSTAIAATKERLHDDPLAVPLIAARSARCRDP